MLRGIRAPVLAAWVLVALAAWGCGSPRPPEPTATLSPAPFNPEAVVRRSGEVMESLETFHFRLHHETGNLELLPGLILDEVEGDVISPDKLSLTYRGTFGTGFAIRGSLITMGDAGYMTNPLTGEWEAGPTGVSSMGFFDPRRGIAEMMSGVEELSLLDGAGDARRVYRIGGTLVADALGPLVGATLEGTNVTAELTIDVDQSYLLEARISGAVTPRDSEDVVRVIIISAFNEPLTIEPPL